MRQRVQPSGILVYFYEALLIMILTCVITTTRCANVGASQRISSKVLTSPAENWNVTSDSGGPVSPTSANTGGYQRTQPGGPVITSDSTVRATQNVLQDTADVGSAAVTNYLSHGTQHRYPESKESIINPKPMQTTESNLGVTASVFSTRPEEPMQFSAQAYEAHPPIETPRQSRFLAELHVSIRQMVGSVGGGLMRQLLQAEISADCLIGLLHFVRALDDLEPWALRIIDATAKYPTGLLQLANADLGAYDECIETVVRDEQGNEKNRGQYCNVRVSIGDDPALIRDLFPAILLSHRKAENFTVYATDDRLPKITLGVCFIAACSAEELENIGRTLLGSSIISVKNCVTNKEADTTTTETCIIVVLAVLAATIVPATSFECFSYNWNETRKKSTIYKCITAFSALRNTKLITSINTDKNSESHLYRFVHGIRFLSMFMICLGHSYATITNSTGRIINAIFYNEHWLMMTVYSAFMAVDTFFFLSGFLLYCVLSKHSGNRILIGTVAIIRRFIRCTIPLFFVLMCIHLLPLIASGPNSEEFYSRFYVQFHKHWWDLLIQIHNWRQDTSLGTMQTTMLHLWYLSADFQLFVVAVIVIQTCGPKKCLAASTFAALSITSCAISAWQVYGTNMTPFVVIVHESYDTVMNTLKLYYMLPFYHGVCFFSGCITFLLVERYGKAKISWVIQTLLWLAVLFSALYCVFMKIAWYQSSEPATEAMRLFHAFTDRILWSIFVAWFTFACSTGRGGVLCSFLSWKAFVPLSRLSFGVYLIHYPFYLLVHHVSRERVFYSHFTLISQCFSVITWSYILSYFLFIACDAPTGNLDKLVFMRQQQSNVACTSTEVPRTRQNDASGDKMKTLPDRNSGESSVNSSVFAAPASHGAAVNSAEQGSEECWRL